MITTGDKNPSFGLALDGKPSHVPNGHMHVEMDTSKVYFYDEKNDTWYEDTSSSGGGGGGGGGLVVTFNMSNVPDKTNAEIAAAASAGQPVIFNWEDFFAGRVSAVADITVSGGSLSRAYAYAAKPFSGSGYLCSETYNGTQWSTTAATFSIADPD